MKRLGRLPWSRTAGAAAVLLLSLAAADDVARAGGPNEDAAHAARGHASSDSAAPSSDDTAGLLMRLEVVGHVGGVIDALDCTVGRCYAAAADRIVVIGTDDPSRPRLLGETARLPAPTDRIAATGDRAYVLCRSGLAIVDASDPTHPRVVGWSAEAPAGLQPGAALDGSGAYAFVEGLEASGAGAAGRLRIVDATDPHRPRVVGELELPSAVRDPGLHVEGSRAYLASGAQGVRIVDISDPAHPEEIGTAHSVHACDCRSEGDRLFVADLRGLSLYDVADPADPRLLGQWVGFGCSHLAVIADRAFLFRAGWGLLVLDVADPAAMIAVGTHMDEEASAMDVRPEAAFLAVGGAGLRVVDASAVMPAGVVGSAAFDASPRGLAVHGDTIYVAAGDEGLRIVDMRDPALPRQLGSLDTPGGATAVAANGDHAFVAAGAGGLRVIDVRDPTAPREVGSWEAGPAMDIDVAGSIACVVGWGGPPQRPELSVIDVSDPAGPVRVGRLETASYRVFRVRLSGTTAFVLGDASSIEVIDLSVASAPREVASIAVSTATDFDAVGDRLYVTSPDVGLVVVDTRNPASPRITATVSTLGGNDHVAVSEDTLAVSGRFQPDAGRWVRFLDVSSSALPRETSLLELVDHPAPRGAPFAPTGDIADLAAGAGRAYVATDYYAGSASARGTVVALDPSEAFPARVVGALGTVSGNAVAVSESRAYVLGNGTLQVVDASDPSAPRQAGALSGLHAAADIAAEGRTVFVIRAAGLLAVVDAADDARPRVSGTLRVAERATGLDVAGGMAYVAAGVEGLRVVDVRDPTAPVTVGSLDAVWAADVAVSATRAVVVGPKRITLVDVSHPTAPAVLGSAPTSAELQTDVSLHDRTAFVVSHWLEGDPGLLVVDCSDPVAPRLAAELAWPAYSEAVAADPNMPAALVLDAFATLYLVDVANPAAPRRADVAELATSAWLRGPGEAALAIGDGHVYAVTANTGLTVIRTVASPIATRLHLPFVAVVGDR